MTRQLKLKPGLEPPEISELAAAMRDGTWLDMRVVDVGDFERVKVTCLHIYPDRDVVTVVQNFRLTPESVGLTQFVVDIDCEDIMAMDTTMCESADDVQHLEVAERPMNAEDTSFFEHQKDMVIQAVAELAGGTPMELMKSLTGGSRKGQDVIDRRHLVLWVLFEMTDLTPSDLCWELGWKSPMPFQSCRYKFNGPHTDEKWPKLLKAIMERVDELLNGEYRRPEHNHWKDVCIL
jgi:hypothetical protein